MAIAETTDMIYLDLGNKDTVDCRQCGSGSGLICRINRLHKSSIVVATFLIVFQENSRKPYIFSYLLHVFVSGYFVLNVVLLPL